MARHTSKGSRKIQEAEELLSKFADNATDHRMKKQFLWAAQEKYGPSIIIRVDSTKRLCFYCIACTKEMNNVKGLVDHSNSGNHLKMTDSPFLSPRKVELVPGKKTAAKDYPRTSIKYHILNSSIEIIGLQFIEEYMHPSKQNYYKCILCGAYGYLEHIFHHVKGARHTDKYLKYRINFIDPSLIDAEKQSLRHLIYKKEGIDVDRVVVYKDRRLYPNLWIQQARRKTTNPVKPSVESGCSPGTDDDEEMINLNVNVSDPLAGMSSQFAPLRNPSPPPLSPKGDVSNKSVQAFTFGALDWLMKKFTFFNLLKDHHCVKIQTHEEAHRACVNAFKAGEFSLRVMKFKEEESTVHYKGLKSILGKLQYIIIADHKVPTECHNYLCSLEKNHNKM